MRNRLVLAVTILSCLVGGTALVVSEGYAKDGMVVEQVNANLMRVRRADGHWEELRLMPLAEHLCRGSNELFDRYCD